MSKGFKYYFIILTIIFNNGCSTLDEHRAPIFNRHAHEGELHDKKKNMQNGEEKPFDSSDSTLDPISGDWRPEFYIVERGDTLTEIALNHGLSYKDLVAWNNIQNPDLIPIGLKLRLRPAIGQSTEKNDQGEYAKSTEMTLLPGDKNGNRSKYIKWMWPTIGQLLYTFGKGENTKGIGISGRDRQSVVASASGVVVYSGSGIRAYGNMIIIKHNASYLSVYARNSVVMVQEGQVVAQGQKISEIEPGSSHTSSLHFEIRRLGKPVDPVALLPKI